MRFPALMVLVGLMLLLGDLRFASGDFECGEGAVRFNNECYLIQQGSCPASSLLIRDKCCRENCVRTCTAENCWHCCEVETPSLPQIPGTAVPPQIPVTQCQNSGCNTQCNQGGSCQQTNCATKLPCQQSNCSNCGTGTSCTTTTTTCVNCVQQTNCGNCGGSTSNQSGCQQTNCVQKTNCAQQTNCTNCVQQTNCGGSTSNQGGCQQTNCGQQTNCAQQTNCVQQTNCTNCVQQTNCANCGGSTSNQGGCQQTNCAQQTNCSNCGGSPCKQVNCQQTNCGCNIPITNCPIPPVYPPTTLPPTQPTTAHTTTPSPPLEIKCPPGTIPIGRYCRPLYCPKGTIWIKDECIVLVCPDGTVWNGQRCAIPEPTTHNITFTNIVTTQSKETRPGINLNNFNNLTVNMPVEINDSVTDYEGGSDADCENVTDETSTEVTTEPPNGTKCCTVMTPRTCERRNDRWYCYSRRYQRCGDFCMAPVIYLRPPRVYTRPRYVIVPPLSLDCNSGNNCGHPAGGFDCSGCGLGLVENCSQYCYRYSCPSHSCGFYDQQTYCVNNPGSYGCMEADGCFDNGWCS